MLPFCTSFTTLKALDPTLVSQLKETLPAALFEKLNGSLSIDQEQFKLAEYKVLVLEEKLRLVRIEAATQTAPRPSGTAGELTAGRKDHRLYA
jgi:hypothetical protein